MGEDEDEDEESVSEGEGVRALNGYVYFCHCSFLHLGPGHGALFALYVDLSSFELHANGAMAHNWVCPKE
jgi:hypothetical protein